MVACLSGLNRLEEFELGFRSPQIWRGRHLPPSTRCVLPALTSLLFNESCEYLEDLISPIDSRLLDNLDVIVHDLELDTPQLAEFADRTSKLKALREAHVVFDGLDMFVSFPWTRRRGLYFPWTRRRGLHFRIKLMLEEVSVMVQLCTSSFLRTVIPMTRRLYILYSDEVEDNQWVDLLRPFTSVQSLYLSQDISPHIVPTMVWIIEEGTMEVLPSAEYFLGKGATGTYRGLRSHRTVLCRPPPLQSPYSGFAVGQSTRPVVEARISIRAI